MFEYSRSTMQLPQILLQKESIYTERFAKAKSENIFDASCEWMWKLYWISWEHVC